MTELEKRIERVSRIIEESEILFEEYLNLGLPDHHILPSKQGLLELKNVLLTFTEDNFSSLQEIIDSDIENIENMKKSLERKLAILKSKTRKH